MHLDMPNIINMQMKNWSGEEMDIVERLKMLKVECGGRATSIESNKDLNRKKKDPFLKHYQNMYNYQNEISRKAGELAKLIEESDKYSCCFTDWIKEGCKDEFSTAG